MIKMISKRLTKIQKDEILEAYRVGDNIDFIAEKYSCTKNTIIRTVKTLLNESEYKLLKEHRSKVGFTKKNKIDKENLIEKKGNLAQSNVSIPFEAQSMIEDSNIEVDEGSYSNEVKEVASINIDIDDKYSVDKNCRQIAEIEKDKLIDNKLDLIAPLSSDFDFDQNKQQKDFVMLHHESLPESVYMIVDKKVELYPQLISDLPEWSFLPENELQRNAILLFSNQRSAKRNCSRNHRVIKIPNTNIFKLSKSYLILRGVTRLILDDSLIALDG